MNQQEYYESSLKYFKGELEHEITVIKDLKKLFKKAEQEGWEPLDSLGEVISEWEAKRDYLVSTIKVIEEALFTK